MVDSVETAIQYDVELTSTLLQVPGALSQTVMKDPALLLALMDVRARQNNHDVSISQELRTDRLPFIDATAQIGQETHSRFS